MHPYCVFPTWYILIAYACFSMVRCPFAGADDPSWISIMGVHIHKFSCTLIGGGATDKNPWWAVNRMSPTQKFTYPNLDPHYWAEWPCMIFAYLTLKPHNFLKSSNLGTIRPPLKSWESGLYSGILTFQNRLFTAKLCVLKVDMSCSDFVRFLRGTGQSWVGIRRYSISNLYHPINPITYMGGCHLWWGLDLNGCMTKIL